MTLCPRKDRKARTRWTDEGPGRRVRSVRAERREARGLEGRESVFRDGWNGAWRFRYGAVLRDMPELNKPTHGVWWPGLGADPALWRQHRTAWICQLLSCFQLLYSLQRRGWSSFSSFPFLWFLLCLLSQNEAMRLDAVAHCSNGLTTGRKICIST